jgi:small neutral amino acid transporter SnatA (MarC family)
MDDDHQRAQIARLETRIEALSQSIERGHKIRLAARAAIVLGAMLMAAIALGAIRFDALPLIAALSAIIGGIVLLGSNRSTLNETTEALQAAEAERAALINHIELRVVSGGRAGNGHDDGAAFGRG